jgi:hypothetical protein
MTDEIHNALIGFQIEKSDSPKTHEFSNASIMVKTRTIFIANIK